MKTLLGRDVVLSLLDPVPEGMRIGPNQVVLNSRELADIHAGRAAVLLDDLREAMRRYDKEWLRQMLEEAGR